MLINIIAHIILAAEAAAIAFMMAAWIRDRRNRDGW
jgi:hypothetical protein